MIPELMPCGLCGREFARRDLTKHHCLPREEGGTPDHVALICRQGHGMIHATYTNATLFPPLALARYLQRRRGLRDDVRELTVPPAPVNAILSAALRVEAAWVRHFDAPFGSSLLCLARKP